MQIVILDLYHKKLYLATIQWNVPKCNFQGIHSALYPSFDSVHAHVLAGKYSLSFYYWVK